MLMAICGNYKYTMSMDFGFRTGK